MVASVTPKPTVPVEHLAHATLNVRITVSEFTLKREHDVAEAMGSRIWRRMRGEPTPPTRNEVMFTGKVASGALTAFTAPPVQFDATVGEPVNTETWPIMFAGRMQRDANLRFGAVERDPEFAAPAALARAVGAVGSSAGSATGNWALTAAGAAGKLTDGILTAAMADDHLGAVDVVVRREQLHELDVGARAHFNAENENYSITVDFLRMPDD